MALIYRSIWLRFKTKYDSEDAALSMPTLEIRWRDQAI